jgi:microcystin degradation protein MlrC
MSERAPMRIGIGGIYHESNTFVARPTTMAMFEDCHVHYGGDVVEHWKGTCSEINGFLEGARVYGFEVAPALMAWGMPSGTVTAEAFEMLAGELTRRLAAAAPLDGVLLSLHGAMVAENFEDADGEILRRVRGLIGPKPLVATLDYHANVTDEMVRCADALVGYDTYPHVDQVERGLEAAAILHRMLAQRLKVRMALARRPLLPHILRQATDGPPIRDVLAWAHELERREGVVAVTVCAGFPYADVPDAGFSVISVVRDDAGLARSVAEEVAELAWVRRCEFKAALPGPEEAVRCALSEGAGLTVLADVSDNLGAGTPGDGTTLLFELLRQGARDALVLLADPEAVTAAIAAGVRQRVCLRVGAKVDRHHGDPVEIEGVVRTISDGIFPNVGPMRDGVVEDQGRTAVIEANGVLVVLTERRMPMWNLQQLKALGIEPSRLRAIVVKGAVAYRAAYEPIARRVIPVDTPGLAAADVRRFHYRRLKRPIYPLDEI